MIRKNYALYEDTRGVSHIFALGRVNFFSLSPFSERIPYDDYLSAFFFSDFLKVHDSGESSTERKEKFIACTFLSDGSSSLNDIVERNFFPQSLSSTITQKLLKLGSIPKSQKAFDYVYEITSTSMAICEIYDNNVIVDSWSSGNQPNYHHPVGQFILGFAFYYLIKATYDKFRWFFKDQSTDFIIGFTEASKLDVSERSPTGYPMGLLDFFADVIFFNFENDLSPCENRPNEITWVGNPLSYLSLSPD